MERREEMFDLRTVDGVRLNPLCEEESDNDSLLSRRKIRRWKTLTGRGVATKLIFKMPPKADLSWSSAVDTEQPLSPSERLGRAGMWRGGRKSSKLNNVDGER